MNVIDIGRDVCVTAWRVRVCVCVGGGVMSANKAEFGGDVKGLPYVV